MAAQLSTYKRLLSKYYTKLATVIARLKSEQLETIKLPDQETSPVTIRESHRRLEEGIGAIETCNTKIQELLQNYAIAIDKCETGSEKETEDFEEYTSRGETLLCSSLDYIVLLKARANAFISYTPMRFSSAGNYGNGATVGEAVGIKRTELPALPIPTFHGDLWEWDNFWTLFDANVNSQPLPELYKFNYLLKALRGEPLQAVKKFRVSQDNYVKAITFLKTKYGDNEQLINKLYDRLDKAHLTSPAVKEQRKLLEQIQAIVAQLQEKNEHVDNQCITKQVLSKFPIRIQRKVLERKYTQADNTFGMETLLNLLEEFITTEEKVSLFTREATPRQQPVSPTSPKGKEEPKKWINKCMYCGEDHKSITCTKYTTPYSRTQYLREHKLCLICASPKHITADCKKRMCFECQGPHHTSCCFKKGTAGEEKRNTDQKTKESKQKELRKIRPAQTKSSSVTSAKIHQTSQKWDKDETTIYELQTSKQVSGTSSTYLPTGEIQVMNPITRKLRKIPVLLDTGAELSFIDKNLAEELHLPTIETTRLKLRTFGSEKVNESLSRKVELEAWDAEGNAYQLQLLTYDTLTKPLKTPPLLQKDMQFMQSLNLKTSTTWNQKPLILLGCDQLWQLIREDIPHVKLPSGLHLLPTKLGHLLTGQVQKEYQIAQIGKEDTDLETWDKYWTLEAQVNGIVNEISDNEENDEKQSWENYWMLEKEGTEEFSNSATEASKNAGALRDSPREIQVMDPNSKRLRKIPVLLDTGAELSFIDKKLAEDLRLPTLETARLRLRTFGSEEVKESLSRKVELEAWDVDGQAFQLQLLTYDTLTRPLKTPTLLEKDLKFLQSLNLEAGSRAAQNSKPQILLGSDQLWQLIKEDTPHIKLPSGLHLLPTRLGHLLTGQMYQEGQVTQVKEDDKELEIWNKYWSLESQVNGVVEEIRVKKDCKQAKPSNSSKIRKRSIIKAKSSVPKQTVMKLTQTARKDKLSKTSTDFRKMAQSTEEFDDLISIAKNKISKSLLLRYLVTAREELNNQTKICNTFRQDWEHTKLQFSDTKEAPRDKIIILLNLRRAASLARESYIKLCTRYILLTKWLGSFPHASNESEQWINDELLENMKIMNKQMSTLVNELEQESDKVENLYRKSSIRIRQVQRQVVMKDASEQVENEDERARQMGLNVPRLDEDEEEVSVESLVAQEQGVTMDDELQHKLIQRRQLKQEIREVEKALDALPLRLLGDVEGGTQVQVTCVFCHEKNKHYSDSCPQVIDGDDRLLIARRKGLCIRCLHHCAPGKCHFSRKSCFYCRRVQGTIAEKFRPRDGEHHKALCSVSNFEDMLRQKELDVRNEYQELEQEIQQLQERPGPRKQVPPLARRHEGQHQAGGSVANDKGNKQ